MNNPMVSICLICYNQQDYIEDALLGVAMQEVDFDFELLIADDCSTDNTLQIINRVLSGSGIKHYRILDRPSNIGMQKNWYDALTQAKGKYIALLEGDDYWTDRRKLQMQIDFLEDNHEYVGCFHNSEERYEAKEIPSRLYCEFPAAVDIDFEALCKANVMPSCSLVFRLKVGFPFPDWFFTLKMVDWPLNIMNSQYGNYKYIPKVMGVHRLHSQSVWSLQSAKVNHQNIADAYEIMRNGFSHSPKHEEIIRNAQDRFMSRGKKKISVINKMRDKCVGVLKKLISVIERN